MLPTAVHLPSIAICYQVIYRDSSESRRVTLGTISTVTPIRFMATLCSYCLVNERNGFSLRFRIFFRVTRLVPPLPQIGIKIFNLVYLFWDFLIPLGENVLIAVWQHQSFMESECIF